MSTTVTLSALLRTPHEVFDKLNDGDVLVTRRDGDDLRLSKAERSEAEAATVQALAQLIAASLDDQTCDQLADRLAGPFPWIAFLPPQHRRQFVGEFLRLTRASASIGRFERLAIALEAWKATAEAYADPGLTPDGSDLDELEVVSVADDPRQSG